MIMMKAEMEGDMCVLVDKPVFESNPDDCKIFVSHFSKSSKKEFYADRHEIAPGPLGVSVMVHQIPESSGVIRVNQMEFVNYHVIPDSPPERI